MKYHVGFDIELKKNPYKGRYVAIEGIDGCGKTTQVEKITEYLRGKGITVIQTREPRKTGVIGEIAQKVLTGEIKMSNLALQYLFATDRVLSQEEVVVPTLKKGNVVVSDRSFWSAIVYGILDRTGWKYANNEVNFISIVYSILSMYHQFITPDYTFYLRISLPTALSRLKKKDDVKEIYEDEEKLSKVIEGYDWLSKKFSEKITVIDGEKPVDEITREIISKINL